MLDDGGTLARAAETKDVLKALQDEPSSCKSPALVCLFNTQLIRWQIILRDKLLGQLAEARGRIIKNLEAEKQDSLAKSLNAKEDEERNFNLLFGVGKGAWSLKGWNFEYWILSEKTMKELSQKLVDRERDAIDLVTTSASLEVSLQANRS